MWQNCPKQGSISYYQADLPANQWLGARRRNLAATVTEEKKGISSAAPPGRLGKLGYGFLWLCLGVVCLWTVCTIAIYWLFPDWQTRGAVGDSFGAVSALFSGLAFAGLIYALHLQRKELRYQREEFLATRTVSEAQLAEMRASRQLLAQPVALPEVESFEVQRPRLFYTPPEDEHSAQSRYTVLVLLGNPSQHSAIAVNVRCFLQFGEPRKVLGSTDHYISLVGPGNPTSWAVSRISCLRAMVTAYYSILFANATRGRSPRFL